MPMFAYGNRRGTQGYTCFYNWGGPGSVGPASKFQIAPDPYQDNCDPQRAASPHTNVMNVALGDGSVRGLSASLSPQTWWFAVTPTGGEQLGSDW